MSLNELQKYILVSKYACFLEKEKRREVWEETAARFENMMLLKYPSRSDKIREVCKSVLDMDVMPSMRALQFGGPAMFRRENRGYNCSSSAIDRLRFFPEAMYMLLVGAGVGASVQNCHIKHLPKFSRKRLVNQKLQKKTYVIPDSIEGWANAFGVLLSSFHEEPIKEFEQYFDSDVEFDFSLISPEGYPLSYGMGVCPGPNSLIKALQKNRELLLKSISEGNQKLDSLYSTDFFMHQSDAVLAGGVRRSACSLIFDANDEKMLTAKTGNWFLENPQRARANISATLIRGKTSREDYCKIFKSTKQYGEPATWWTDIEDNIPNPCFRGSTRIATDKGLIKIEDLYKDGKSNIVVSDTRIGKFDVLYKDNIGIELKSATPVVLTGKDKEIFKVTTTHGNYVEVTAGHEFITTTGRKTTKELEIGDEVFLQASEGVFGLNGDYNSGLLLGILTGDGYIHKRKPRKQSSNFIEKVACIDIWEDDYESIPTIENIYINIIKNEEYFNKINKTEKFTSFRTHKRKRIGGARLYRYFDKILNGKIDYIKQRVPEEIFTGKKEFVVGYLQGFLFSDGCISKINNKPHITFYQSNREILEDIQILLQNFGIFSNLYLSRDERYKDMPDGKGGYKSYFCKKQYTLNLNFYNSKLFYEKIGFFGRKEKIFQNLIEQSSENFNKQKFISQIKEIVYIGNEDVYCLTQKETNCVIANGIVIGQCFEISLRPFLDITEQNKHLLKDYQGPTEGNKLSGWQCCNLTTINGRTVKSTDDFYQRCELASLLGTWQAGFTNFPYLGAVSEEITRREALLGVSICGMMHNPEIFLNADVLAKGARLVREINKIESHLIGIKQASRCTTIKPDGNSASALGSFSGCHPGKFRKGFRIVQTNKGEAPYKLFKQLNPQACEQSLWSANSTDDVIRFPVEYEGIIEDDITAVQFLSYVKLIHNSWVKEGKNEELCTHPSLQHNVSNTVKVRPTEWDAVRDYIYDNNANLGGVSMIPWSGDKDYAQAPFTAVFDEKEQEEMYGRINSEDCEELINAGVSAYGHLWTACDSVIYGHFEINQSQIIWKDEFKAFSKKYFDEDIKKTTYCLKDYYNWQLYKKLKKSFYPVDYKFLWENQVSHSMTGEVACAGPSGCEV